jgi:sugar-phosphatase
MDGLLVDSEPLWKRAEKQVFGNLGLNLNDDLLRQVMGFRLSEVVAHWYRYQNWPNPNFKQTERDIIDTMKLLIEEEAVAMKGVYEVLIYLRSRGKKIALASSSSMELIEAVVKKLNLAELFDQLHSAEKEEFGKPHPGIFLTAAKAMNAEPFECLVFEDSKNGMIAAKAARMNCVVVPEAIHFHEQWWSIADAKISVLDDYIALEKISDKE